MLKNLIEVSKNIIGVVSVDSLEEIKIPHQLRSDIQDGLLQGNLSVQPFSSYSRTSATNSNYAIFPNQMYKFAALMYDFSFEVKKYFECINKYKASKGILDLCSTDFLIVKEKLIESEVFSGDFNDEDYDLFSKFILLGESKSKKNDEYRLGGKSIFNRKDGRTIIRTNEDCFGSILLTQINLPNSSSSIFGDLVYALTENPKLYRNIKSYFQSLTENKSGVGSSHCIFSNNTIRTFVHGVISTLIERSDEKFLFDSLKLYSKEGKDFAELVDEKRLYRLFLVSSSLLDEGALKSGGALRWFKDAFLYNGKHYYLTNQWEDKDGEAPASRDIQTFIELFNNLDSKYRINKVRDIYRLVVSGVSGLTLPKPFLLLAGISGTGKTRFVRQQAKATDSSGQNYELISVRPDWHEPSDLLGYVSRLGNNGPVYVVGAALKFMVKVWKHIVDVTGVDITKQTTFNRAQLGQITPFWLCLDEMNLAPVEQYFADYLSVIETREWTVDGDEHTYQCEPLLKADVFAALVGEDGYGLNALRKDLALGDDNYDTLWEQFVENGISIPFNLIVAGTVNMDETTHGFSRKVIDRALTIDFGRFFPNVYDDFFIPTSKNKVLGFPVISSARHHDFSDVPADINGQRSIEFLSAVNALLKDSPFELAFRALNELLLSVACFKPKDEQELQAVWDDFLMAKVLPRIEGDEDKLRTKDGGDNVLVQMEGLLENQLSTIWNTQRPDLLRTTVNDSVFSIDCHSKAKLAWMRDQLNIKTFTSFWP